MHGHDLLRLVQEGSWTRPSLEAEALRRWGADVRFHTCSLSGLTVGELMDFLVARAKVVERDGVLQVNAGNVCSHG